MTTLGITGGMGSGKSHVCKAFMEQGIPVYDTDKKTKDLLNNNESLRKEIIKKFGEKCFSNDKWNRDYIVDLASKDNSVIDDIGIIIEPYLMQDIREFKNVFFGANTGYFSEIVVIESAILFKSRGMLKEVDKILIVTAPLEVRMERIKKRDPFRSDEEIKLLLSKQNYPALLCKQPDFTFENVGTYEEVMLAVKNIIEKIQKKVCEECSDPLCNGDCKYGSGYAHTKYAN